MAFECRKAMLRRLHQPLFHRILRGAVLDVGAGEDSIGKYKHFFPAIASVRDWNHSDGDGTDLEGIAPQTFHVVHSSHSLEHMRDPLTALRRWGEVTQIGGHVVVLVPDYIMYEHSKWPSENGEHNACFISDLALTRMDTVPGCIWDTALLMDGLNESGLALVRMERLESTFDFDADPLLDQTCFGSGAGECAIEFVWRRVS